jgi:hypothetical protein
LWCSALTLSFKVIKNLDKDLCKIPPSSLTEEELQKKPLSKKADGPRTTQSKKGKKPFNEPDHGSPKKNKRIQ